MILIVPIFFQFAFEMHFNCPFRFGVKPNASPRKPVIRQFSLPAVFKFLFENAVFIANGMSATINIYKFVKIEYIYTVIFLTKYLPVS